MTQIMNLNLLAPEIQESLLFLTKVEQGRDQLKLGELQAVTLEVDWRKQRRSWEALGTITSK